MYILHIIHKQPNNMYITLNYTNSNMCVYINLSANYTYNLQTAVCLLSTIVNNMRTAVRILFAKYPLIVRIFEDQFS